VKCDRCEREATVMVGLQCGFVFLCDAEYHNAHLVAIFPITEYPSTTWRVYFTRLLEKRLLSKWK
jgi:hypothetical protein